MGSWALAGPIFMITKHIWKGANVKLVASQTCYLVMSILNKDLVVFFRRNINSQNASYLKSCIHNLNGDKNCPIFRVGDIVKSCGQNFSQVAFYVSRKVLFTIHAYNFRKI